MTTLSFHDVSLRYPARKGAPEGRTPLVLDQISLSIETGEFVVVIGRSGSGKTSLLNLAAGFLQPSGGRIAVDGTTVSGPSADRAVVFQDDALYPWLDARDNIAFPLKLRGVPEAVRHTRAQELLDVVGLTDAGRRRISELSGGMRQRVGIARALASDPLFLLLDEPLGALDAMTRTRMQGFLLDVWSKSRAGALLITHSIDEALLLASRVVVLSSNPGRLAADIQTGFAAELLGGASVAQVKASPLYKRMHDGLTGLIHSISEGKEAAA